MPGQYTEYAFETAIEHHLTISSGCEKGDRDAGSARYVACSLATY